MTSTADNDNEQLLPSLVDEIARLDPERILFSFTKTKTPSDGFHDVSAEAFAHAVDRCAWFIKDTLGHGQDFPTLLYMGPQDLNYCILVLATIKSGYQLLLSSPRNTLEAHLSLLDQTDCNVFLLPPVFPLPIVKQIQAAREMQVVEIAPPLHWLASDIPHKPYPYNKTFAEAKMEPFVVLHTSGSTGLPKVVVQTHGTWMAQSAFTTLPSQGFQPVYPAMCVGTRLYTAFPLFHCAGLGIGLVSPIYGGFTAVFAQFPPSAEVANGVHIYGNVQHSCLPPSTLVDLAKVPEYLDNLSKLYQITYGGGPCPQAVGNMVSAKTRLLNCLGTTEGGPLPAQLCKPGDWEYMTFSPVLGAEYRHISDNLYEQVILRDPKLQRYQAVFGTFPHLEEYHMKDLYSKHPTDKDTWLYRGRLDDIIVLSTGEKLNPIEMEETISSHSAISAALVAGVGRFQTSLLIETANPPTCKKERTELQNLIWPSIQVANKSAPSHARIHQDMIIFTATEKPMSRAGKGTIQRQATIALYQAELDALYTHSEAKLDGKFGDGSEKTDELGRDQIAENIQDIICQSTDIPLDMLLPDADLFDLGLDSLQVTLITKSINRLLGGQGSKRSITAQNIYSYPTISSLTSAVLSLLDGQALLFEPESSTRKMQELYNQHSRNLPISGRRPIKSLPGGSVVLLTGATGSLGSYILDALINDPRVSLVYCLSRGRNSVERQRKSQADKGLAGLAPKVECFDATLSEPFFGLHSRDYRTILTATTVVIHNAWKVDFNLSIDSFATHIDIVRRIVDFSAFSTFGAKVFFISSLAAVGNLSGDVPEQIYDKWTSPQSAGYGQSKFVSERILSLSAKEAKIPVSICRIGQISGPISGTGGNWPKQEWLPSLIASSKYLNMIPNTLGTMDLIDWVPVDVAGNVIAQLALGKNEQALAKVYHVSNPQRIQWAALLPTILQNLGSSIKTVSFEEWVENLIESGSTTENLDVNPALKIITFFEGLRNANSRAVLLGTSKTTLEMASSLASLGPIQKVWMDNWMKQWAF